ncbi:alpha/beta hydrolase [Alteromonas sp. C1M14]|uniref:alpha/beta hydrolase n=1 Tax=Alteromonas sp. C1M14 TaxID=2841567 RepID=UPI001C087EDC|nr:alpha/beta hydrolase [Alteromonas sp. C1M14]MBU2978244.1 alpha/beta hydrolase [Alteromonas sp. C1M14]
MNCQKKGLAKAVFVVITALVTACLNAQEREAEDTIFPLYEAGEVGSLGVPETQVIQKQAQETLIFNVSEPTLELFLPEPNTATGTAVIIAPGGGFVALTYNQGGTVIARKLAEQGVTALVLKYRTIQSSGDPMRVPDVHQSEMDMLMTRVATGVPNEIPEFAGERRAVEDGARAIEIVRQHATKWGIDPNRVGMLGLSAGAFLAVDLAIGKEVNRPDFIGLLYGGLRSPVPANAPSVFIAAAADDPFLATDSLKIFSAWRAVGAPAELHMYEKGGHGFDLRPKGTTSDEWLDQFIKWMRVRKLL